MKEPHSSAGYLLSQATLDNFFLPTGCTRDILCFHTGDRSVGRGKGDAMDASAPVTAKVRFI